MEKISAEAKKRYSEKIKEHKQRIEEIQIETKLLESEIEKIKTTVESENAQNGPRGVGYMQLQLAEQYLNQVSYYILTSALSLSLLGIKNEGYLNEARKCCYKCIICLEEIVTPYLDVPFSEYEEALARVEEFKDKQKYDLARKIGFSIDSVVEGFGENSKWKWSFVELEGRYAVITKNLINMKTFIAKLDPRVEGYSDRLSHLNLAKRLLQQASDRYREKYELSTMRLDDIKQGILFLAALRRLHILLGEADKAEVIKRKIDIWKTKMESDQKKKEHARRMEKLQKTGKLSK